ncbi:MAG TPA: GntR family transcriptional regulator [Gemmatimonadaceae bacterium]|nr:GntR family transcriptional regulator [Gemmatimonadaceae bacterium]
MRPPSIDPASPVPLYHQIAEQIRARISAGELAPGDALQPLRAAAEKWGVHLHTVRHAYAALAREGLLEIGRRAVGTRVARRTPARPSRRGTEAELAAFIARTFAEGESRFGLDPAALADTMRAEADRALGSRASAVTITECSLYQCEMHVREIVARYAVEARPWVLTAGEPPPGPVIATYFHYNDIRRLWPRRLPDVRFMTIRPRADLRERIGRRARVVHVCERDMATAETLIGDIYTLLGRTRVRLEPLVTRRPAEALEQSGSAPVLFAPRVWAQLDERARQHPRAIELVYTFDPVELERFAMECGWSERAMERAS